MNGFDLIHFIRPLWLLALPLAILLPWWWKRMHRSTGDWEKVCDPHLLRFLSVSQGGGSGRSGKTGSVLAGLAVAIAAFALSGPSWQQLPESSLSARDAHVIALDLSNSMLAEDLRPSRLIRARFRIADLLNQTLEGQTGLVAYAGDAYVVSPLTNDTNTIASLLPALAPEVMPVSGSRADKAMTLAAELLQRAGFQRGEILLVTDATDSRAEAKARELADRGIVTSVLGIGTVDGAPIPSGSGFITDRSGNVVIARLDEAALQRVANAGGGRYSRISADMQDTTPWMSLEGGEFARREDALDRRWKDAGPYVLLLLLPLALVGFRRGLLFCLPLLFPLLFPALVLSASLYSPSAQAGWWDDLWQRRDQQAWDALQAGDSNRAAALAKSPDLSGEAWYRSGGYSNALSAWLNEDTADANYNRGNALAQMGELDAALEAYDRALELDPEMEDARFNRDLLQQMQEQQQQQEQQEGDEGDEGEQGDQESDSESQQGEEGEEGQEGQDSESQQEGEQEAGQGEEESGDQEETDHTQAWTEEDAQAMEQWLRRIPDDPGGLLRRKFLYEHQRRGEPKSESDTW